MNMSLIPRNVLSLNFMIRSRDPIYSVSTLVTVLQNLVNVKRSYVFSKTKYTFISAKEFMTSRWSKCLKTNRNVLQSVIFSSWRGWSGLRLDFALWFSWGHWPIQSIRWFNINSSSKECILASIRDQNLVGISRRDPKKIILMRHMPCVAWHIFFLVEWI